MQRKDSIPKAKKTIAKALYSEIANVGKTIEGSKKRVTWRVQVEENQDHEITLTHSLASGKKVLRVDGAVVHKSSGLSFGDWEFMFHVKNNHVLHCIIKPSTDLNDMYDIIVDGVSFCRLPSPHDDKYRNVNRSATYYNSNERPGRYVDQPSTVALPKSFTSQNSTKQLQSNNNIISNNITNINLTNKDMKPWVCTSCTFVNEKVLAPVCEVCLEPKQILKTSEESIKNFSQGNPASTNDNFPTSSKHELMFSSFEESHAAFDPFNSKNTLQASIEQGKSQNQTNMFNPFDINMNTTFTNSQSMSSVQPSYLSHTLNQSNTISLPQNQQNHQFPTISASDDNIQSLLAGLDFTTTIPNSSINILPPAPAQVPTNSSQSVENVTKSAANLVKKKSEKDLWATDIVNLDKLKKQTTTSSTSQSIFLSPPVNGKININLNQLKKPDTMLSSKSSSTNNILSNGPKSTQIGLNPGFFTSNNGMNQSTYYNTTNYEMTSQFMTQSPLNQNGFSTSMVTSQPRNPLCTANNNNINNNLSVPLNQFSTITSSPMGIPQNNIPFNTTTNNNDLFSKNNMNMNQQSNIKGPFQTVNGINNNTNSIMISNTTTKPPTALTFDPFAGLN